MKQQVQVKMKEMSAEMEVQLLEQQKQMEEAVQAGEMLPERYELEMQKAQEMMQQQLQSAEQEYMSELQNETSKIENQVVSEKEFNVLLDEFEEVFHTASFIMWTPIHTEIFNGTMDYNEIHTSFDGSVAQGAADYISTEELDILFYLTS